MRAFPISSSRTQLTDPATDFLSLLVASKYVGVGFGRAVVRSLPLYAVFFLTIAFTVVFPDVVLWLPKMLLPESVGCFKAPGGGGYICPP